MPQSSKCHPLFDLYTSVGTWPRPTLTFLLHLLLYLFHSSSGASSSSVALMSL
jgi:hypothetical protein